MKLWGKQARGRYSTFHSRMPPENPGSSSTTKRTWIARLGQTNDPRAAELLAGLLLESSRRKLAQAALLRIGLVAEPAVIRVLENNFDNQATAESCLMLLAELGGDDSLRAIEILLAKQEQWPVKSKAEASLNAIKLRLEDRRGDTDN